MQSPASGNLNELDSLLNDLSNARYGSGFDKKRKPQIFCNMSVMHEF